MAQLRAGRGSQCASNDSTGLLEARGIAIPMSRKANPRDNAACDSFMKTLKYEEVLRKEYRDLKEALTSIPDFLEKVYNERRLHGAGLLAAGGVRGEPGGAELSANGEQCLDCWSQPRGAGVFLAAAVTILENNHECTSDANPLPFPRNGSV